MMDHSKQQSTINLAECLYFLAFDFINKHFDYINDSLFGRFSYSSESDAWINLGGKNQNAFSVYRRTCIYQI